MYPKFIVYDTYIELFHCRYSLIWIILEQFYIYFRVGFVLFVDTYNQKVFGLFRGAIFFPNFSFFFGFYLYRACSRYKFKL